MKYHILIWRWSRVNNSVGTGACVFFKRGCRCLTLESLDSWNKLLGPRFLETDDCMGYKSKQAKKSTKIEFGDDDDCADFWDGKFDQCDEDPEAIETIAKITTKSKAAAISEIKSYLLAAEL